MDDKKIGQMYIYKFDRNKFTSIAKLEGKTQAELFKELLEKYLKDKES